MPADTNPLDMHEANRVRDRILLTGGITVSFLLFWWMGKVFSIPQHYGYAVSLMQQPWAGVGLIVAWVALFVSVLLATLITSRVHFEAGLYCAALGMSALSFRGGPMRYVLFDASGPRIFFAMAVELLLLYAAIAVAWLGLVMLRNMNLLRADADYASISESHSDDEPIPSQGALALVTHVVIMIFFMTLLAQTDKKGQVMAAVGISAFLASLASHSLFKVRPSAWYFFGPLIVGVIGYILAGFGDGYWTTGEIFGINPALGRPLPLDYAAFGPAGAILGYWTSRRWHELHQHDPENPDEVERELEHQQA